MKLETNQPISKRVALHTLGCRLNFSETGSIAKGFKDRGYEVVPFGEDADVNFINTCTVTDDADSTCRNLIRKAYRKSPESKIVVAGCYAQMEPEAIAAMKGVDLVLGTTEKYKVFDFLNEENETTVHIDKTDEFWGAATSLEDGHTRAFLKIQDGCNYICSFCIIPHARGRSRTISIDDATKEAISLTDSGFKEIVLTGVNIGEYESTSGEKLSTLVREVIKTPGLQRLRLSSVEPNTINDELLNVMKSSSKCLDHFHIPMQSADNQILKEMRRKYNFEQYQEIIAKVKEAFPKAGIGADIITGFPGESEEQFQNTYLALKRLPITHFHVFPYSKRQKTSAASREDQVPHHIKKGRVRLLRELGEQKLADFARGMIGHTNDVLFERRDKNGLFRGYTTNFIKVFVQSDTDLSNQILPTTITGPRGTSLLGVISSSS